MGAHKVHRCAVAYRFLLIAELCAHRCTADVAAALNCVLTGALQVSLLLPTGWTGWTWTSRPRFLPLLVLLVLLLARFDDGMYR
jgi:hypothetical protein